MAKGGRHVVYCHGYSRTNKQMVVVWVRNMGLGRVLK